MSHSKMLEKVPFLAWLKRNAERRRSCCDWFRSAFLNTVLLNWFIKDLTQIYGQSAILGWFVRKQNAFYGQTGIFRWFVRKFLHIMMRIYGHKPLFGAFVRKTGSKRLNFYGQTAVFAHFVRNRHFSGRPFTDRVPIFIDVSVNDDDFAKCSAAHHLLNHCTWLRLRAKRWFLRFARNLRPHCFGKGNWVEHFLNFGWFCSTLRAARAEFRGSGRTFFQILEILFYFLSRAGRIWSQR